MSEMKCLSCGASIDSTATECKYCGELIAIQAPQYQPPQYQPPLTYAPTGVPIGSKSKVTAGILAILLGGLGVHKFYLGKVGLGILYLVFCWTWVPAIIGLIEGIIYLTSSDENFYNKYVRH